MIEPRLIVQTNPAPVVMSPSCSMSDVPVKIVAVTWPDDARHPHIDHIENAFDAVGRGQMFN